MSCTLRCAPDEVKPCDRGARDPIWDLVTQYRRICRDKHTLQAAILRELDDLERDAARDVEAARVALAAIRMEQRAGVADRSGSGGADGDGDGDPEPGERPAITDLDGPREEDPIRTGARASRPADRSAPAPAPHAPDLERDPDIPPCTCTRVGAPDAAVPPCTCCTAVFDKYDKMIGALRTRAPPITVSFIPREEIPWPVLPSGSTGSDADGVFGKKTLELDLDRVAAFAAGYALYKGTPAGRTLQVLLGHWISMDKRLKDASARAGCAAPDAGSEVAHTRKGIRNVRSRLMAIMDEHRRAEQEPAVFTAYEQRMSVRVHSGSQLSLSLSQGIPWPILPQPGEFYPMPVSGKPPQPQKIGRFVRAYSIWKGCSKADIHARMLPEWEALRTSYVGCDDQTKKWIEGVVNYLAEPA